MLSAVQAVGSTGRKSRRPSHIFNGRWMPFQLQPFFLAPVLPGETLKSFTLQNRVITDPIAHPLIGWWLEHYVFYVKHRDLGGESETIRTEVQQMMLNPEWVKTNIDDPTGDTRYDFRAGNINWTKMCLQRVVEEYFRNEGEAWDVVTIDGLPACAINNQNLLQSAELADNVEDDVLVNEAGTGTLMASELDQAFRQWEFMRNNDMTNMSYEDFLRTYGVRTSRIEQHRPELVRYMREWQYPSSVVNPADGLPSAAVSWAVSERGDKDRFFTEPGFLIGIVCARPKVYMEQKGMASQYLDRAFDWMPAVLRDDVYSSLKQYGNGAGPASQVTDTNGYWIDVRDLFVHGDQMYFSSTSTLEALAPSSANFPNVVDLPTAGLNIEYPDIDDAKGFFTDVAGSRWNLRCDGVISLNILGTQQDHT